MTIWSRIMRLFKADIHGVMDQLEDKELLAKHYLREMEYCLRHKEACMQRLSDRVSQNENRQKKYAKEVEKLEKDLVLAVQKEKDEIAKMLIRRQRSQMVYLEGLRQQHKELDCKLEQLKNLFSEQQIRYQTLRAKASIFQKTASQDTFPGLDVVVKTIGCEASISEDEIEIELLRRKDSLSQQGATV